MSLTSLVTRLGERAPIPDVLTRAAIGFFVERARRALAGGGPEVDAAFAREMAGRPIAEHADDANAQHYEVPAEFFRLVLGPRLKYSSALYPVPRASSPHSEVEERSGQDARGTRARAPGLAQVEERALAETCAHAGPADGQRILELGCGWGSLSLWMAQHYPGARITSVSNSASQREEIEARDRAQGLGNLDVITADMNDFQAIGLYDRVVSVEMFEHIADWGGLLARIRTWLAPEGRLFLHVFAHRAHPYRFDHADGEDWIGHYFFTSGMAPSHGLIRQFGDLFEIEEAWRERLSLSVHGRRLAGQFRPQHR